MKQFHIYKDHKSSTYHAVAEGFSWYGFLFSIVWLFSTCIKRNIFWVFPFLLLYTVSIISILCLGFLIIIDIIFNISFSLIILENPILCIAIVCIISHFFLGVYGNAIIRWTYQNDKFLGIVTASTENGAIMLFKQNNKIVTTRECKDSVRAV